MKTPLFDLRRAAAWLCCLLFPFAAGATVVFQSGFEYSSGAPVVGTNAANLNGADSQIGSFSGTIPNNLVSFENANGGWMLQDGHSDGAGATSDWTIRADFSSTIALDGSSASFDYGTRRTITGNRNKDNTIRGFDSSDNEVFRLIVTAAAPSNIGVLRLGYWDGGAIVWNLPGAADAEGDFPSTITGPNTSLDLSFGATGFTISYIGPGTNSPWSTSEISYLAGSDLAYLTFSGKGGSTDNNRSGFYLDNIAVSAIPEPGMASLLLGFGALAMLARRKR